jgi:hypothetical protein
MRPSDFHPYRAIMGGVWVRTKLNGWYQLPDPSLKPHGVMAREDHRIWHAYVLLGTSITVAACVAALTIAIRGV